MKGFAPSLRPRRHLQHLVANAWWYFVWMVRIIRQATEFGSYGHGVCLRRHPDGRRVHGRSIDRRFRGGARFRSPNSPNMRSLSFRPRAAAGRKRSMGDTTLCCAKEYDSYLIVCFFFVIEPSPTRTGSAKKRNPWLDRDLLATAALLCRTLFPAGLLHSATRTGQTRGLPRRTANIAATAPGSVERAAFGGNARARHVSPSSTPVQG